MAAESNVTEVNYDTIVRAIETRVAELAFDAASRQVRLENAEALAQADSKFLMNAAIVDGILELEDHYAEQKHAIVTGEAQDDYNQTLSTWIRTLAESTRDRIHGREVRWIGVATELILADFLRSGNGDGSSAADNSLQGSAGVAGEFSFEDDVATFSKSIRLDADNIFLIRKTEAQNAYDATIPLAGYALVDERGTAKVNRATRLGLAGITKAEEVRDANNIFQAAIAPKNRQRDIDLAKADADFMKEAARSQMKLEISLSKAATNQAQRGIDIERTAAGKFAFADVDFWLSQSSRDMARTSAATVVPGASGQALFDSARSHAFHHWLLSIRQDYYDYARTNAAEDASLVHQKAIVNDNWTLARSLANRDYIDSQAPKMVDLASDLSDILQTRNAETTLIEGVREVKRAKSSLTYEVEMANTESTFASAVARITENDEILYQQIFNNLKVIKIAEQKEAEKRWLAEEIDHRIQYNVGAPTPGPNNDPTFGVADIEKKATQSNADRQAIFNTQIALLTKSHEDQLTQHRVTAWRGETARENITRTSKGLADQTFWTARENDRVASLQSMHQTLGTPWSHSLVLAAQAGVNALPQIATNYQTLIGLRNSSETTYKESLIQAFIVRENALSAARKLSTESVAESEKTRTRETAAAEATFLESASAGAKQYLEELVEDPDANPLIYYRSHSEAYAARLQKIASVEQTANRIKLFNDYMLLRRKAGREQAYRHAEADAYLSSITRWSEYDETFNVSVAAANAISAMNMAVSNPSPWLQHNAEKTAGFYNSTVINEQKKRIAAIKKAEGQRVNELSIAYAEVAHQYFKIGSSYFESETELKVLHDDAVTQAKTIIRLAGKQYEVDLPKLSEIEKPDYEVDRVIPDAFLTEIWPFDVANGWTFEVDVEPNSGINIKNEGGHSSEFATKWVSKHANKAFVHGHLTDQTGYFGFDLEDSTNPYWDNDMQINPVVEPERLKEYENLFPSWTQKVLDSDQFKEYPFTRIDQLYLLERFYDEPHLQRDGSLSIPTHHERYWLFERLDVEDVEVSERYYWNFEVGGGEYGIDIDDQPNTSLPARKVSSPATPNASTNSTQLANQLRSLRAFANVAAAARNNDDTAETTSSPTETDSPTNADEETTISIGVTDGRKFDPEEVRKLIVAMNPNIDDIAKAKASFGTSVRAARPLPFPFDREQPQSRSLRENPLSTEDLFGVDSRYRTRDRASAHEGVNVQVAPGDSSLEVAKTVEKEIVTSIVMVDSQTITNDSGSGHANTALAVLDGALTGVAHIGAFTRGLFTGLVVDGALGTLGGVWGLAWGAVELTISAKWFQYYVLTGQYEKAAETKYAKSATAIFSTVTNPTVQALYRDFSPRFGLPLGLLDGLEPESEEFLLAIKPAISKITTALDNAWTDKTPEEKTELVGRIIGVATFEIGTFVGTGGTASVAILIKAGKLGKLVKFLDSLNLPESAKKAIIEALEIVARKLNAPSSALINGVLPVLNKTCFVAGTPILTPDGEQDIDKFKIGDFVLSRNENDPAGQLRPRAIERVFELSAPVIELRLGGQSIQTTAEHPFYVSEKGWVRAGELEVGDFVLGHTDQTTPVDAVIVSDRTEPVYNIRVAEDHTYFVGCESWGFSVWVHNAYSIRKLTDGTWEVLDSSLNVVKKGLSEADALVHQRAFNFGINGVQTASKTVFNKKGVRIDFENPNPGQRPGQIHAQIGDEKYYYDPLTKLFRTLGGESPPRSVLKILESSDALTAIQKALRMLGEL